MLRVSISLRALVFVLLLGAVTVTGSDVAHSAPAMANLTADDEITFTRTGQDVGHDINVADNMGGLRFYGCPDLTTTPDCAAIQFFGNQSSGFPGQLFIDSGAHDNAAIRFRTAGSGGTITERMRVTADGRVGIGTSSPNQKLTVQTGTSNYGVVHTDGTRTVSTYVGGATADGGWFGTQSNHPLHLFSADGPARLTIATNGNAGIGTTAPESTLQVAGNYLQIPTRTGEPPASDCSSFAHFGRMVIQNSESPINPAGGGRLWICSERCTPDSCLILWVVK